MYNTYQIHSTSGLPYIRYVRYLSKRMTYAREAQRLKYKSRILNARFVIRKSDRGHSEIPQTTGGMRVVRPYLNQYSLWGDSTARPSESPFPADDRGLSKLRPISTPYTRPNTPTTLYGASGAT